MKCRLYHRGGSDWGHSCVELINHASASEEGRGCFWSVKEVRKFLHGDCSIGDPLTAPAHEICILHYTSVSSNNSGSVFPRIRHSLQVQFWQIGKNPVVVYSRLLGKSPVETHRFLDRLATEHGRGGKYGEPEPKSSPAPFALLRDAKRCDPHSPALSRS